MLEYKEASSADDSGGWGRCDISRDHVDDKEDDWIRNLAVELTGAASVAELANAERGTVWAQNLSRIRSLAVSRRRSMLEGPTVESDGSYV